MPTINNLSTVTTVTSGDLVPIYSQSNGDARAASMSTILGYVEDNFASPDFSTVTAAPTSGFTETLDASTTGIWLILSPAGTLASGTIVLPAPGDCFDGQTIIVTSKEEITSLTVNGNGGNVNGAPTALLANGFFQLRFYALTSTWYCVAQSLGSTSTFTDLTLLGDIVNGDGETMLAFVQEGVGTAVNYPSLAYSTTGNGVALAATGSDTNIDINIVQKGTGDIFIGTGNAAQTVIDGNATEVRGTTVALASDTTVTVTATDGNIALSATGTGRDISVTADDQINIATISGNIGITATSGSINLTTSTSSFVDVSGVAKQTPVTVTNLPSAVTMGAGARYFVSDANATTFASVVAGGGSNNVPVYSDGTNWRIG